MPQVAPTFHLKMIISELNWLELNFFFLLIFICLAFSSFSVKSVNSRQRKKAILKDHINKRLGSLFDLLKVLYNLLDLWYKPEIIGAVEF